MQNSRNSTITFINGRRMSWLKAQKRGVWGLPSSRGRYSEARAELQELGFGSASRFIACAGPVALFEAVVDGPIFYDDSYVFEGSGPREPYAVRFRFTSIRWIGMPWCPERTMDGRSWRLWVEDVFLRRRSVYRLRRSALSNPEIASRLETINLLNKQVA